MEKVTATSFREASAQDWEVLVAQGQQAYVDGAGDAFLQMLEAQRHNDGHGWPVNNYQHSLQCATRAARAGEDDEFVIMALFHDLAQDLFPYAHDRMTATLLEPYLSEANHWVVANHQVFQVHFRTHSRFDTQACMRHRGHPHFERAMYFCEHYDQNCFDPDYAHEPLEFFAPMVKAHFTPVMQRALQTY